MTVAECLLLGRELLTGRVLLDLRDDNVDGVSYAIAEVYSVDELDWARSYVPLHGRVERRMASVVRTGLPTNRSIGHAELPMDDTASLSALASLATALRAELRPPAPAKVPSPPRAASTAPRPTPEITAPHYTPWSPSRSRTR